MVAAAYGICCFIAMPDDAAIEKSQMLEALGAARWCSVTEGSMVQALGYNC